VIVCPACGRENPDDGRFCGACATPLAAAAAPREERKVVTVVFADLVGSTARAERLDPEDVRAVLAPYHARLRHELERFGGTVEKFIGDAVVAVFGAPVVHEDDPERAVRAALAVQEAITELNDADPSLALQVRVGVNTGEALVALDASPALGEGMVSGDVINTSARLQAAAPPGGVLVGEATHRATERVIDYEPADPVAAKGKAGPVRVWRALAPRARFGVDLGGAGRAPLVGRDHEAAQLVGALARVRAERQPQLVTLVGVPGIGKSRLVQELWRVVDDDDEIILWRQGRSLPYGEGVAFWALGEMVKAHAGILESDDADTASAKLARALSGLTVAESERVWVERHLRPLVGLVTDDGVGGDARGPEATAAWRRFLEATAEEGPAVLVFEDLHWADDGLLDFVDALSDRVSGVPLLVVCTARPELLERRPGWGGGKRNAQTVSLPPLTDEATASLLHALLGQSALPASTQSALLRSAGGVPLFAEELARMLDTGDGYEEVPQTLQGIVAARIDGLPDDEKRLLHAASILGKVFWSDGLAATSGDEPWSLDERLHALERKEFIRRERRSAVEGARQYAFVHALVRDTAYGQIPRAARARGHRLAAEWIESLPGDRAEDRAEVLAHHLTSAIEYGAAAGAAVDDLRPLAARALQQAGDRAWSLGVPIEAARFYRAAIEIAPGVEADPRLLFGLGRSLVYAENAGERELEQAVDGLLARGDVMTAAEALIALHEVRWVGGQTGTGLLERACKLVADRLDTRVGAYAVGSLGRFYGLAGRTTEAVELDERSMAGAESIGDRRLYAWALNNRGNARFQAGDLGGTGDIERSLEISLEIGSFDVGRCRINLGNHYDDRGDLADAETQLRAGLEFAHAHGSARFERILTSELARNRFLTGHWDEALELAARFADEARGGYHESEMKGVMVVIAAERGERLDVEDVGRVTTRAREIGDIQVLHPWLAAAARALARVGDEAAAGFLEELLAEFGGRASGYAQGPWVHDAAVAATLLGRERDVLDVVDLAGGTRWTDTAVALLSGEALRAADILADMGAFDEAGARLLAAQAMAAEGRNGEAVAQAERALAVYRVLRAPPGIAQARALAGLAA
jgi:class 3 adenylate cyclase/tetratricopeptide (TPR) repeat protein